MRRVSLLLAATLLAACDGATHPAPRCELKITTPRLVNETVPPETPVVLAADVVASDLPAGARVEWTWGGRTITGNPVTTELSQGQSRFTATLRGPDGAVLARDTATLRNPFDSLAVAMEPCTRHLLRGESMPPGCLRAAVTANPRGYPYVVTWRLNGGQGVRDPAALPIAALPAGTHYLFVDAAVSGRTTAATVMSTLTVHDTTVVAGRAWAVTPAGAAAPAGPLRVFAKVGEVMDSTDVAGDGTFSLRSRGALGDSLDVWIDARDRAARTAHPAWMRLPAARAAEPVRVLMIPRAWTIARGHFAGQTVPVSMDLAFASPPGEASAYYYPRGAVSWDHARLPVPVAFGHAATHEPITPADSLHFWAAAEAAMQADGVRWFTPAPEGMPGLHRVMVRIDHSIGASARGGSHPDGNGHLENGTVLFLNPTVMRSPNVVQHELRHVLGVGHTCSWRSVMAAFTCPSRMLEYEPTEWDVAYLHLLHLTHRLQVELSAPYNLREALAGERRLVLGN